MAQQNQPGFRLEEASLIRRLTRVVTIPCIALVSSTRRKRLTRYRCDLAARQFQLDAWPADHRGGSLRRHSRVRWIVASGRDPRLHDARLEGGQSREAARPAAANPAASAICAIIYKAAARRCKNLGLMMREGCSRKAST